MNNYAEAVCVELRRLLPGEPSMLLRMYALLAMTKGVDTTMADVHDAWSLVKSFYVSGHRSLVPFDELPTEVQELDRPYVVAIHLVAEQVAGP